MNLEKILKLKGALGLLMAFAGPFVPWANGEANLKMTLVGAALAGLGAGMAWADSLLSDMRADRALAKAEAEAAKNG